MPRNQCNIDLANDLESLFFRIIAETSPKEIGRGECIAVIFQNPLENQDGTANANEVWVGSATNLIWLLIPGTESPLIYAEDFKDVYIKRSDVIPFGAIFAASIEYAGLGYTIGDVLTLPGGNADARLTVDTVDANGAILTFTITTPGSNYAEGIEVSTGGTGERSIRFSSLNAGGALYAPGDTFTVDGGGTLAAGVVDTVDGGGAVLTYHLTSRGKDYTSANGVATTATAGVGAGLKLNISAQSASFDITSVQGNAGVTVLAYRKRKGGRQ